MLALLSHVQITQKGTPAADLFTGLTAVTLMVQFNCVPLLSGVHLLPSLAHSSWSQEHALECSLHVDLHLRI